MALDLRSLKRHAKEYVEWQAHSRVTNVRFVRRYALFGMEDVVLDVEIEDDEDPKWWVIGGSTPMNLYSQRAFEHFDVAYSLHLGIALRMRDQGFSESDEEPSEIGYDAFISHASEDKAKVVKPLAKHLTGMGFRIWYDEFELKIGDSLRQSIDRGLATSNYGIIVLSEAFFAKNWPQYELNGLVAREMEGRKLILPVWHGVTKADVIKYSPSLADKVAGSTDRGSIRSLALRVAEVLRVIPASP